MRLLAALWIEGWLGHVFAGDTTHLVSVVVAVFLLGLALCAASSKSDQALIAEIFAEHGRDGFLAAWLRARGVDWAADLIPDLTNLAATSEDLSPLVVDEDDLEFEFTLEEEEITP